MAGNGVHYGRKRQEQPNGDERERQAKRGPERHLLSVPSPREERPRDKPHGYADHNLPAQRPCGHVQGQGARQRLACLRSADYYAEAEQTDAGT